MKLSRSTARPASANGSIPRPTPVPMTGVTVTRVTVACFRQGPGWCLEHPGAFFSRWMRIAGGSFGVFRSVRTTKSPPISFTIDGHQVIAVAAGRTLVVLGL